MSHIRKTTKQESDAYAAYRKASSECVLYALTAPAEDPELARLRRRASAYRVQWMTAARKLEAADLRDADRTPRRRTVHA